MAQIRCCDGDVSCACDHRWSPEEVRRLREVCQTYERGTRAQVELLAAQTLEIERLKEMLRIAAEALEDIIQQARWGDDASESATMIADTALSQVRAEEDSGEAPRERDLSL